jgi:gluconolactonase
MRQLPLACLLILSAISPENWSQEGKVGDWIGSVRQRDPRLDSKLDEIVSRDAVVEIIPDRSGLKHYEGPVWDYKGGYLLYGDYLAKTIMKWTPRGRTLKGQVSTYMKDIEIIGMTFDPYGGLVTAGLGEVIRLEENGRRTVLAGEYEGKPLNLTNDLAYKSDGALYFTDSGHLGWDEGRNKKLLSNEAARVFLLKDGNLKLLTTKVPRANGLAFSPDEKYLYVVSSSHMTITKFDVLPDDTIGAPTLFLNMYVGGPPCFPAECVSDMVVIDDVQVDEKGNVYATGAGGVWIISPEGQHLGTITGMHLPVLALAFGGDDGKTLYMSSDVGTMIPVANPDDVSGLSRIRLKIPGMEFVRAKALKHR